MINGYRFNKYIGLFGEENHMLLDLFLRLSTNDINNVEQLLKSAVVRQVYNAASFSSWFMPFGLRESWR